MVAASSKRPTDDFAALRKGMLEFLLLRMIGAQKLYAGDIAKRLRDTPFKAPHGTLYPLLSRMARSGLVEHEWKESAAGPPRKYYSLTRAGAQKLEALTQYWKTLSETIAAFAK